MKIKTLLISLFRITIVIIAIFGLMEIKPAYCQNNNDSARAAINSLTHLYNKGKLTEPDYLDTISKTMQLFLSRDIHFSNKELLGLLATYRKLSLKNKSDSGKMLEYYRMLSNQAKMAGRMGEMLYYAEKIKDLEQASSKQPSITSLAFIADYYNIKSAHKHTLSMYREHRGFIRSFSQKVRNNEIEGEEIAKYANVLGHFGEAAFRSGDTISGGEVLGVLDQVCESLQNVQKATSEQYARIKYIQLLTLYEKGVALNEIPVVWKSISGLDKLSKDKRTPEYLKNYIEFTVTDKKIIYFLEQHISDSAIYYITIFNKLYNKKDHPYNAYMIRKYTARSLYNQGRYKECTDTLIGAIDMIEKIRAGTVTEINDMMYALTKVEEQQFTIKEAEIRQETSDRRFYAAGTSLIVLLFGSMFIIGAVRYRQKSRFLEFKLNLARNIHDETNPALLFAKSLAKSYRVNQGSETKTELETHLENTMELIRGLSHDLKSTKQHSVSDLIKSTNTILQKLNPDKEFNSKINRDINEPAFLSHFQFSQLMAIINECITNTLKHAAFRNIEIGFYRQKNLMKITYRDDGLGWPNTADAEGIGLNNIQERVEKMNANLRITNNYPSGYFIEIAFKLH